jgi:outer membrane protein TolC
MGLAACSNLCRAQDATDVQASAPVCDLPTCIQMALGRQPAITAYRASLASARDNLRGLNDIMVPSFISRELPIRRRQACLGVGVAAAGVDLAEHDTIYAVTRLYWAAQYARAQKQVADSTVDRLKATLDSAKGFVQGGSREVTTSSVDKISIYLRLAETRRVEAATGIERALAGLREAMGLEPGCTLDLPAEPLPNPAVVVNRDDIVGLALSRRGELVQASNLARVTCLEVNAQKTSCRPTMRTFASVVDIHSRPIPEGTSDGEYRPAAVGPDYPTTLAGPKRDRLARACDLHARADAMVEKTRNLVALEAENAYLKWLEASQKVPAATEAADKSTGLATDTQKDFAGGVKVKVEDVLANEVLEAQAHVTHNEALYQQAIALAALERVTAGGFQVPWNQANLPATEPTMHSTQTNSNSN